MIEELERVALTGPMPEYGLEADDVGTVVHVHAGGKGYIIEFVSLVGETIAVATVRAEAVRALRPREVPHARAMA